MEGDRVKGALARIESALARIEIAATRPGASSASDSEIARKYAALDAAVRGGLADLDKLIERLEQ